MVLCDAVIRKLPGALGDESSAVEESFSPALEGAPEYPHYTPAGRIPGLGGTRRAAVRPPRADPGLASGAGPTPGERRGETATISGPRPAPGPAPSFAMSSVIESSSGRNCAACRTSPRAIACACISRLSRARGAAPRSSRAWCSSAGPRRAGDVHGPQASHSRGGERTFPVHSPKIERIEIAARGDVRRAKLYYLRERVGKRARVRERRAAGAEEVVEGGLLHVPEAPPVAEGEMPADDEAPREGEDEVVVEDAEEAEAGDEGEAVAPEQPADDAAGEAAPADGDGERE